MNTPTTLVLFGATGDLARKKIWKSLYQLHRQKQLPKGFLIIGHSRRDWDDADLHDFVREVLLKENKKDKESVGSFLSIVSYAKGDLLDSSSYSRLAELLFEKDTHTRVCSNKLFFLAIPPSYYEEVFTLLARSGLSTPCAQVRDSQGVHEVDGTWTRVLVEKPFGKNIETAKKLDQTLGSLFEEEQIFRIDHYLAKDAVQNILTFRFQNNIFRPIWNSEYVDRIEILMHEEIDVSQRGELYDEIGALRDVGQNHILQMLALVTMEEPSEITCDNIRQSRAHLLRDTSSISKKYIKAQYDGYKEVNGVAPDSTTETFFSAELEIKNDRWRGVPIRIEAGKGLPEKKTQVRLYFKNIENKNKRNQDEAVNILTFYIHPREGVEITLLSKKPGLKNDMQEKKLFMSFNSKNTEENNFVNDAYAKVLHDAILGDQTIFTMTQEVQAQWNIVMPILNSWKSEQPHIYVKGQLPKKTDGKVKKP